MSHGDAVINGDGIKLDAVAAVGVNDFFDALADWMQMHVAGNKLREGIGNGDDRLVKVFRFHARGAP